MADTISIIKRISLGNRWLVIAKITGDGADTSKTAAELGLTRIDAVWWADVDDDNAMQTAVYAGTTITHEAITNTSIQLLFAVGY